METVADKTGYPAEMLELDMRLDADLGIDSIKRVEIFSAIQDQCPGAARGPEEIGTLGTLRDIVSFLGGRSSSDAGSNKRPSAAAVPVKNTADRSQSYSNRWPRRRAIPIDMLELDMRLDVDLGIDSIKRVEIFSAVSERLPSAPVRSARSSSRRCELWTDRRILVGPTAGVPVQTEERIRATLPICQRSIVVSAPTSRARTDRQRRKERRRPSPRHRRSAALYPRATPLEMPDRRETVMFREGGTVWITDDGSPLAQALEGRLADAGLTPRSSRSRESRRRRRRIACVA